MTNPGRGIAGHNGDPPQVQQIPLSTLVTFTGAQVDVVNLPDGGRQLQIAIPGSATLYSLPLPADVARELGGKLFSAVPIAKPGEMPS
jgi:hypothetical protein